MGRDHFIQIRVNPEEHAALKSLAASRLVTLSGLVRGLVAGYIEQASVTTRENVTTELPKKGPSVEGAWKMGENPDRGTTAEPDPMRSRGASTPEAGLDVPEAAPTDEGGGAPSAAASTSRVDLLDARFCPVPGFPALSERELQEMMPADDVDFGLPGRTGWNTRRCTKHPSLIPEGPRCKSCGVWL